MLSKAIANFFAGGIISGVPFLMSSLTESIFTTPAPQTNDQFQTLANSVNTMGSQVGNVIPIICHMIGLMFFIFGLWELKKSLEDGEFGSYETSEPVKSIIAEQKKEESKVDLIKKEIPEIKVVKKEEPKKSTLTDEKELNDLIILIEQKTQVLKINPQLKDDLETKMVVEKTMTEYVPQIVSNYMAIAPDLRKTIGESGVSAFENTKKQLEIILQGLNDIELKMLAKNHMKQQMLEKFLEDRFNTKEDMLEPEKWIS